MTDSQDGKISKENYHALLQQKQRQHKNKVRNRIQRTRINEKQFWKMAKELQGSSADKCSRIPPMKNGARFTTDCKEKCTGFAEAFIAKATLPDGGQYNPRGQTYQKFQEFTCSVTDVKKWLQNLNPSKASGPNALSPAAYKNLSRALSHPLHTIYSRMMQLGQWPRQWKHSAICPIFKKKDPAVYENYRPISLIDVPSKLLETQLARHMTKMIIHNGYLPENQYGFRPKHSCTDLAFCVIGKATLALNKREDFYLLQTDIAGAFDRVDRDQLKQRLHEAGVPQHLHRLLSNYLSDRTFHIRVSGAKSDNHPLDVGVVQGSGLGPVMWNIFFAKVFDATEDTGIGFADDLNIITSDKTKLERIKRQVMRACSDARITMEPAKETLTTFTPPCKPAPREEQTTRLVGVLVDPKLKMEEHIDHVLQKARIAKVRLMRMRPYCTPDQLLSMYKTTIWTALEIGCVCYAHASESTLRKIDAFQHSTLRMLGVQQTMLPSMTTRRRTAHATMIYKQSVMGQGPNVVHQLFTLAAPDTREHLRRNTTVRHRHQLNLNKKPRDLKIYDMFCSPFQSYNSIHPSVFPDPPSIQNFKRLLSASM
jgi:hypothetical protein